MTTWNYIIGDEKDFEGAPDWALYRAQVKINGNLLDAWEGRDNRYCYTLKSEGTDAKMEEYDDGGFINWGWAARPTIVAQREPVTNATPVATNDVVNHPSHYTQGGIECIDAITAATVGKTGIEAVCVANVVKYLWRYEEKNGLEDVKKARWYLERLISELSEGE